jgi:hypothetical protein
MATSHTLIAEGALHRPIPHHRLITFTSATKPTNKQIGTATSNHPATRSLVFCNSGMSYGRPDQVYTIVPVDGVVELDPFPANWSANPGKDMILIRFLRGLVGELERHGSLLIYCKQGHPSKNRQCWQSSHVAWCIGASSGHGYERGSLDGFSLSIGSSVEVIKAHSHIVIFKSSFSFEPRHMAHKHIPGCSYQSDTLWEALSSMLTCIGLCSVGLSGSSATS